MATTEPLEVTLTRALLTLEAEDPNADGFAAVDMTLRHQLANLLGVGLATAEEIDDAEEGFWTECETCPGQLTYLQGVGEFNICRACHWDGTCQQGSCDGGCDVFPHLEHGASPGAVDGQPHLALNVHVITSSYGMIPDVYALTASPTEAAREFTKACRQAALDKSDVHTDDDGSPFRFVQPMVDGRMSRQPLSPTEVELAIAARLATFDWGHGTSLNDSGFATDGDDWEIRWETQTLNVTARQLARASRHNLNV